jgi:ribosomal protein RSM22 (predicted rRNA methylase)
MFPVIFKSSHRIIDLCTTDGRFERRIVAKSHGDEGGYRLSKKLDWGDLWTLGRRIPNKYRKEGLKSKRLW